jgi:hypothetical protein
VLRFAEKVSAGMCYGFSDTDDIAPATEKICQQWFVDGGCRRYVKFNAAAFEPYTAARMAGELAAVFAAALAQNGAESSLR